VIRPDRIHSLSPRPGRRALGESQPTAYFFDVSDVAVFGLAGAPSSDFCSGGFFGASFSQPTPTPAKIATAIIARKIRIGFVSLT